MLGALIGDIVGSVYEFRPIKTKDFPLFTPGCAYTDDSVMTAAVADALLAPGGEADLPRRLVSAMRDMAETVPIDPTVGGYGGRFHRWLFTPGMGPYGSWGNGSAMRVSSVGWLWDTVDQVERMAGITAAVTHDHPEGIKGAQATAVAILLGRQGETPEAIRQVITARYGYDLSRSVENIRPNYRFDESCQGTVPEAMTCAVESVGFVDAVRNAVSLGGDADTLAAIAGSIAEAIHGIPGDVAAEALTYLHPRLVDVLNRFRQATAHLR